ncbi:MAG: GatB/YqeY domain-containing protein [Candidatus Omnitrophica bacterium]|nr:GatB/YqeY domain-containing protein [Candidatus Omnitrophota bacterium]
MLEDKLNQDLRKALKEKDAIKASVLRMLKADITNAEIKLNEQSLKDEGVLKIIQQHINRHKDSIEQFKKANRNDLFEKEEKELAVLNTYMPKQLSDNELEALVKSAIAELGAITKKDTGKVIKTVMEKSKGAADGKRISQFVGQRLTGESNA